VKSCLFPVFITHDTIVIIVLKLMLFPSQDVPYIQSIHHENQTKTLYLVSTLGVLDPGEDFRGVEVLVGQMVEFG
jgi:hypothetical protein